MKTAIVALLITLTGPAVWAQKYSKRPASGVAPDGSHRQEIKLGIRSLRSQPRDLKAHQIAPPPAPGVAQCYVDPNGSLSGIFVNTSPIPSGSTITGSMTLLDDGSYIDFTGETLTQTLSAGSVVNLPAITSFGDLWYSTGAALDIAVDIQPPRGTTTEVDCEVLVGEAFGNSDLANNEPLIGGASLSVAGNNDLDLVLTGYFTSDPATVVLTDLYNIYLVPASAVTLAGGQINVDLSQISGLDLTSSDILFVNVSQDGYTNTIQYSYLPGTPGTFNLAPQ